MNSSWKPPPRGRPSYEESMMRSILDVFTDTMRTLIKELEDFFAISQERDRLDNESVTRTIQQPIWGAAWNHPTPTDFETEAGPIQEPIRKVYSQEKDMNHEQDLSGDMIKVVQYSIILNVTGFADDACVLISNKTIAFGDNMTGEDFTAWIIAKEADQIAKAVVSCKNIPRSINYQKFLRVAFRVLSRFHRADLRWKELQADSVAKIADNTKPPMKIQKVPPEWPNDFEDKFTETAEKLLKEKYIDLDTDREKQFITDVKELLFHRQNQ